jgi:uncharacterized protein (DUF302 family)
VKDNKIHALTGLTVAACCVLAVLQVTSNRAPTVLFNEQPKGPHPIPVLDGNGFGTNSAFIGKGDGQGTSVKARTTELMQPTRFTAGYRPARHTVPAGPLGTNQAFVGMHDGAGQSTKARATMLDQEYNNYGQKARTFYKKAGLMAKGESKWASSLQTGYEKAPIQMLAEHNAVHPAAPTVWRQIGVANPAPQAQQVMKQNDNFGYKAPVQMLSQKQQPTNVWQQIGAQEPSQAAKGAMQSSDNFGYKAPVQMLAEKPQPTNVWQQIGVPEPSQAAKGAMQSSDNFGYKAPVQMLSEKHHPSPNVWQQIGAPEPKQAAQQVMSNSDNFGYKASPQMLLECGKGGPCPNLANALHKAGLTSRAEAKWISKMPVEGFKAPTEKLVQVGKGAAKEVAKGISSFLFTKPHAAGL